ncbi:MAG: GntR family transcriptional regulator [Tannerellaceae bacterium]|jgi:DNA-binding transcriptional regulator YhcF (GntR family)|nr:GntR family transcriptional regulator [Tannerellaceae bacterium]
MNYSANQNIFTQIADQVCERVLSGQYLPDSRIPSVRDLSTEMEVNPNTVMRSFERLQQHGIIYNKRGIGYFISPEAREKIHELRHFHLIEEVLPSVFREMSLLGIGLDEVAKAFQTYLSTHKNEAS